MRKPVRKSGHKEVKTTGHSWDGIEELNTPLPRWWLWIFYLCIAFAIVYQILYPAWPLPGGETPGVLGYSTRAAEAAKMAKIAAANAPLNKALVAIDMTKLKDNPKLYNYAVEDGAAVFRTNCTPCHGSGAQGAKGYPNLLDNDWLWGGSIKQILFTVTHGVRNQGDPDARTSEMPKFGEILTKAEIAQVVQHVMKISGQKYDAALEKKGAQVFADNCAACHGDAGKGNRDIGAPNLTDAIWLYGGDPATVTHTVTYARYGIMPNWDAKLSKPQLRAVAAYVHQLGGGE